MNPAPHAHFPVERPTILCAECGRKGPAGARNAKIPQGKAHDPCRDEQRKRREARATGRAKR